MNLFDLAVSSSTLHLRHETCSSFAARGTPRRMAVLALLAVPRGVSSCSACVIGSLSTIAARGRGLAVQRRDDPGGNLARHAEHDPRQRGADPVPQRRGQARQRRPALHHAIAAVGPTSRAACCSTTRWTRAKPTTARATRAPTTSRRTWRSSASTPRRCPCVASGCHRGRRRGRLRSRQPRRGQAAADRLGHLHRDRALPFHGGQRGRSGVAHPPRCPSQRTF